MKLWTRSFVTEKVTQKIVLQSKCRGDRKRLRLILLVVCSSSFSFFSTSWRPFFVRNVENWLFCWDEKDPTSHSLLMTLSASTFSWHTQNWLSPNMFVVWSLLCCDALPSLWKPKVGDIFNSRQYQNNETSLNLQCRPLVQKTSQTKQMVSRDLTIEKPFLHLSGWFHTFWCPKIFKHSYLMEQMIHARYFKRNRDFTFQK